MTLIKSISGIRGTIGGHAADNLTPIDVVKFTTAYARLIKDKNPGKRITVVVGRDARLSGSMVDSLVEGTLLGTGVDVINVGLCTTPGTEMAVITHKADGGIIITASHNPRQWNALKLLNERGEFLDDAEGKQVLAMAEDTEYSYPTIDHIGKVVLREDFNQKHIEQVLALKLVDKEAVRKRKFKVVVDAVNSVGGIVIPALLRELGCEVVELNCEPTGEFAHNPEPLPQNLTEISEVIRREGADLGVVVDPDVDRLAFVMENGEMFVEEYTLVAVADYVLQHTKGNTVSNLSSSRALSDITSRYEGCSYEAAAVGEISEKLISVKPLVSSIPPTLAMISAACLGEMRGTKGYFSKFLESVMREKMTVSFSYPGVLYHAISVISFHFSPAPAAYVSDRAAKQLFQSPLQAQPASFGRAKARHARLAPV